MVKIITGLIHKINTITVFEEKNYDEIYIRNVSAGLLYLLHNTIYLKIIKKGSLEKLEIPFHLALGNSEQWLLDKAVLKDNTPITDICDNLKVMRGLVQQIPGGSITPGVPTILTDWLGGGFIRSKYEKQYNTEFSLETRDMSAMTTHIPVQIPFTLKIQCSSENERWKVWQQIIKTYYKVKKFYYSFEGFRKIDAQVAFPESFGMDRQNKFSYSEKEDKPIFECELTVVTYMPVIDITTERFRNQKIETFSINTILSDRNKSTDGNNKV